MTASEFCERRLLPLTMAFGVGVIVTTFAAEPREPIAATDELAITIECVPGIEGAPVWVASGARP